VPVVAEEQHNYSEEDDDLKLSEEGEDEKLQSELD
jgi:hypothetical protein